jgi:hypothetical protein
MKTARHIPVLLLLALLLLGLVFAASAGAASKADIDAALAKGVGYLVPLQSTGGAPTGAWPSDEYYSANTGFAVAVLEHYAEQLRKAPLDPSYAYAANVQAGLDFLFASAVYDPVNHWVYWNDNGINAYQTGPCLMAIARSGAPNASVVGGDLNGFTYKQVAQMAVDWLASAQVTTGNANGAWYYYKDGAESGDQSATGWVGMGLGYAAHSMGCTIPADTLSRLSIWNGFIQSTTPGPEFGGAAYTEYGGWINTYKTGHLLFNQSLCGDTVATQRVQDALTFMTVHWADKTNGYYSYQDYGWRGDPAAVDPNELKPSYIATAAAMKGFTALGIETFNGIDWYADFSDVIVANQLADGHWEGGGYDENESTLRSTCWALLTLLKGSTYIPPRVATNAATSVTGEAATLNGALEDLGSGTTVNVSFEYGTATATYTAETTPVARTATGAFSAAVTGLTPGATYYFRAKAAGEAVAYGEEMTFTAPLVTNPPTTVVKGVPGGWVRRAVSLRFVATAAPDGAPVAYTEYRVAAGQWVRGTRVTIKRQGATKIAYRSADTLGNVETAKTCTVRIDSVAPVVHDYGSPVTWQGGIMQCAYKVTDATSSRVTTKLAITRYHVPIHQYKLGVRPANRRLVTAVTCDLGVGTWCWRVVAYDQAGNRGVGKWHFIEVYPNFRR